jgi:TolB-like protein/Tfp pilus assembly protein PilF
MKSVQPPAASGADFRLGEWLVQPTLGRISGAGGPVHLRPLLIELLELLARNPGRLVTKEEINRTVWGKRFLAESALTRLVAELRQILGDDIARPRFIETIPKRGYRLIAPVSLEGGAAMGPSVAVLPFTDMAQGKDQEYFCDGLAEELTNALTRLPGLRVIARTSAFSFKGKAVDVREIGRQLNVGAIVEGGVQRSADRLRVSVQVINAADGVHLWSERFDRRADDLFAIEDEIAQAVLAALSITLLGDEERGLIPRHTDDLEAHDLYLRGRYVAARRTPEAYAQAIRYFRQALTRDPGYSVAYASLGACYCGSGFVSYLAPGDAFPKAKAAAARALELDPTLAEAHATLGWAGWAYDWDWPTAEARFDRAEELSPSDGMARFWHAMMLAALGRFEEALVEIQRAWDLDPLSLAIQTNVGFVLYEARRYQEGVDRLLNVLEMDPRFGLANFHLGRTYQPMGKYEQSLAPLEIAAPAFPLALGILGRSWAVLGRRDKAQEILEQLVRLAAKQYVGPLAFSSVYFGLGDDDLALGWLEKGVDAHEGACALMGVDPCWDRYRSNSRFAELLGRLKLRWAPRRG